MTPAGPTRTPPRGRRPATTRPRPRPEAGELRARRAPAPQARRPRPRPPVALGTRPGRPRRRLGVALVGLLVCFGAIVVRLVDVQAVGGEEYSQFGASQRFQRVALPADRGSIFDRNGNDLAVSLPHKTIWADPRLVEDPAAVASALAGPLALDAEAVADLTRRLGSPDLHFTYIARQVDDEVADAVAALELPGVYFLDEARRLNPNGDLARSILGQVGVDNVGLSGLELQFEELLTGDPGELIVEKDPDGRTIPGGQKELEPAHRGDDLVLSIDRSMQHETERVLADAIARHRAKGGTVIVSDPATGEILALANLRRDPETGEVVAAANNAALTEVYEPGSVNKLITIAGALEEGLVTPSTRFDVPDSLQVSDHRFSDSHPHPPASWSVSEILTQSSNVGTIKIAQMLGKERLDRYIRAFGLGSKTALGFPNESAGLLLDPKDWSGTSIGSIPIGHGISVTAVQMLMAYNTIANDGVYVPPRLVMETVDTDGSARPLETDTPHRVVSQETARQLQQMLADVVTEGTGTQASVPGYRAAGKTGTARKPQPNGGYERADGSYAYIATFAGFVPADDPQLSIIVVIDEPQGDIYGGSVAAPVFSDLAGYGLRLFRIAPALEDTTGRAAATDGGAEAASSERVRATPATTSTTVPRASTGSGARTGTG